ncbi:MAG TPA: prepilin-type N-terminal cleavage/methylation domain-containing protein [Candidatus Babeliales bacterium]|nr:prepilin-type N-terminal cleavage/methylation domain-containing protein [Candidatus Babeliales bacterium]
MKRMFKKIHQRGFTLIELMVVIGLTLIMMGIGFKTASFFNEKLVRLELNRFYATCLYAQRFAQATHKQQTLKFNLAHHWYEYNNCRYKLPSQVRFGLVPGVQGPPSAPQQYLTSPASFTDNCITFSVHGIIQPGAIYFTDRDRSVLYALSCSVAQHSYLRRYRYDGKWRLLT